MVTHNVKLGIGFAVAGLIICAALFLLGQARDTFSASDKQAVRGEVPFLTGDNVYWYMNMSDTPLIDPVWTLRYGRKSADGGCSTSSFGKMRPGYTMMEGRVVAMDWDTCAYIWVEGAVGKKR